MAVLPVQGVLHAAPSRAGASTACVWVCVGVSAPAMTALQRWTCSPACSLSAACSLRPSAERGMVGTPYRLTQLQPETCRKTQQTSALLQPPMLPCSHHATTCNYSTFSACRPPPIHACMHAAPPAHSITDGISTPEPQNMEDEGQWSRVPSAHPTTVMRLDAPRACA